VRVQLTIVDAATGKTLARGAGRARMIVCGQRKLRVDLRTVHGSGVVTVTTVQA
jgi:hypothetical protein